MSQALILASASDVRKKLLSNAGLIFSTQPARIDEDMIRDALLAEAASPRDIVDALAELKAVKVNGKNPEAIVIGCDQVLSFEGTLLSKPTSPDNARDQLRMMQGKRHDLLSAVVVYDAGKPVWRHIGVVCMSMDVFSEVYLDGYIERNWDSIQHSVGAYKLEEEGIRLFSQIQGDYFTALGLPLLDLLSYLKLRGFLEQ